MYICNIDASHFTHIVIPMLSEDEKGPKNMPPPFHRGMSVCTSLHPGMESTKGRSCKDAWNSSESDVLFRTAKKQKSVLKLASTEENSRSDSRITEVILGVQEILRRRVPVLSQQPV